MEICLNDVWGTVCDDGWSTADATVVCRQLGYSAQGQTQHHIFVLRFERNFDWIYCKRALTNIWLLLETDLIQLNMSIKIGVYSEMGMLLHEIMHSLQQIQLPSVMPTLVPALAQFTCMLLAALEVRQTLLTATKFAHKFTVCKATQ